MDAYLSLSGAWGGASLGVSVKRSGLARSHPIAAGSVLRPMYIDDCTLSATMLRNPVLYKDKRVA